MKKELGIFLIVVMLALNIYLNTKELEESQDQIMKLQEQLEQLRLDQYQLQMKIESFLDVWNFEIFEVSAYAPLDPRAKEGVCYLGNPRVTSSSKRTTPGVTIAAGPNIPFGTKMFIKGFGWREVHDRGGAIGDSNIDLCVWTQEEAFGIGRRKAVVVWQS